MIDYLHKIKNIDDGITSRPPTNKKYNTKLRLELVTKAKAIGNLKKAANELNVPYKTLYGWVNTYKIGE
jgi:hypothetical protein